MPRPLSDNARRKALSAATELLDQEGMDGFTIEALARRSGVAKTTLYRHWPNRAELLVEALMCRIEELPTPDSGSLLGDLRQLFTALRPVVEDPSSRRLLLDLFSAGVRDPEMAEVHEAMMRERAGVLGAVISRAIGRGEIPDVDLETAINFAHGPLMVRMLTRSEPIGEPELTNLLTMIARGLGAAPR